MEMKDCAKLMENMAKAMTFNLEKPIVMNPSIEGIYAPYEFVDGGYLPHSSEYWANEGKNKEDYYDNDEFHRKYLNVAKSELAEGIEDEKEHSKTLDQIASDAKAGRLKPMEHYLKDIAQTHLDKTKNYYTKLAQMEKSIQKGKVKEHFLTMENNMEIFHTEERSKLINVKENDSVVKSIKENDFHLDGRVDLELQEIRKSADANLKNTHGEQFSTDADKEVIKYLTEIGEIQLDKVPSAYQLPEFASANVKKSTKQEDKDDDQLAEENVGKDRGVGEEKDAATVEMEKEEKKSAPKGIKENPFDKSVGSALDGLIKGKFDNAKEESEEPVDNETEEKDEAKKEMKEIAKKAVKKSDDQDADDVGGDKDKNEKKKEPKTKAADKVEDETEKSMTLLQALNSLIKGCKSDDKEDKLEDIAEEANKQSKKVDISKLHENSNPPKKNVAMGVRG